MQNLRLLFLCGLAVVAAACSGGPLGRDEPDPEPPPRDDISAGRDLFVRYCASCHGMEARGNGPVAGMLSVRPADLTTIARRRGGEFDELEIGAYIDGRRDVGAHGPRMMPVWGRRLDDRNEAMSEEILHLEPGMISDIVAYLYSVQEAEGEPR